MAYSYRSYALPNNRTYTLLWVFIAVLLVSQSITFLVIFQGGTSISTRAQNLEGISAQIQSQLSDINKKISNLNTNITTVSSTQNNIKDQISQIQVNASDDFSGIVNQIKPSVVTIRTNVAEGTGFIITNDGYLVTNAHVLEGASVVNALTTQNKTYRAQLIGYDTNMDVALLKIKGTFTPVKLGNSDNAEIGERVVALGDPLGLSFTATQGIISARDRQGINGLPNYFQTDAPLNPGNSGGPLINAQGQVIGVNNFKVSQAENIGFALEINYAINTVNQISQNNLNETLL